MPLNLWIDPVQLGQVFDNLLSNAVKFSPNGGRICVKLWAGRYRFPALETKEVRQAEELPAIFASIEDQGVGIPQEEFENIWLDFFQIDSSAVRRFGGTGLGLALVKDIIESYEGHIWVDSEVGKGSCFTFALPVRLSEDTPVEMTPLGVTAR